MNSDFSPIEQLRPVHPNEVISQQFQELYRQEVELRNTQIGILEYLIANAHTITESNLREGLKALQGLEI